MQRRAHFLHVCFVVSFLFAWCLASYAQKNPYALADAGTTETLKKADALIAKKQYESAFNAVSVEENEYLLAKKIEISTHHFAQSFMHQLFSFKDLAEDEMLADVRQGEGSFTMVVFDPVKEVEAFVQSFGEKPILHYALGLYYDDVLSCYRGQWLLSDMELVEKSVEHLQKALSADCYDAWSLSVLALGYYRLDNLPDAKKTYEKKVQAGFALSADDAFNMGAVYFQLRDYEPALKYVAQSIDGYGESEQLEYQCDAYILCAQICIAAQWYRQGERYLMECQKKNPGYYRIEQEFISLYASENRKADALRAAAALYALAPENPSAPQLVIQECESAEKSAWLPDFFEQALKDYADSIKAQQNLYFHYAYALHILGDTKKAAKIVKKAKAAFKETDSLTAEIERMLDSFLTQEAD